MKPLSDLSGNQKMITNGSVREAAMLLFAATCLSKIILMQSQWMDSSSVCLGHATEYNFIEARLQLSTWAPSD